MGSKTKSLIWMLSLWSIALLILIISFKLSEKKDFRYIEMALIAGYIIGFSSELHGHKLTSRTQGIIGTIIITLAGIFSLLGGFYWVAAILLLSSLYLNLTLILTRKN